jgi:hypothetical protein
MSYPGLGTNNKDCCALDTFEIHYKKIVSIQISKKRNVLTGFELENTLLLCNVHNG